MEGRFNPGDFLFFQLESGYALIRVLGIDSVNGTQVWHICGYQDLFPDVGAVEAAIADPESLTVAIPHIALSERAFESTQAANIGHVPVFESEQNLIERWHNDPARIVSDRSIRLHLGLR